MSKIRKIDAHAHIGEDKARKMFSLPYNCDAKLLFKLACKNNISDIIVVPPPGQIVCPHLGMKHHPNIYGIEGIPTLLSSNDKMKFKCKCGAIWKVEDPFREVNEYLFKITRKLNKLKKVKFHPLPIIHPLKQKVAQDIQRYFEVYQIKGVKIHPLIDKTSPINYIDSELVDILADLDLKILFHTDNVAPALPTTVLEFVRRTKIYSQLAHACRADPQALRKIHDLKYAVVDISPLNMIIDDRNRLLTNKKFSSYKHFIKYVINLAGENKVLAGSDYFWCGWKEKYYKEQWKEFESFGNEKIIYKNALEFWDLL
jgi:hypothetical protein